MTPPRDPLAELEAEALADLTIVLVPVRLTAECCDQLLRVRNLALFYALNCREDALPLAPPPSTCDGDDPPGGR